MPEESTALALPTNPKIIQELRIVLPALIVALGGQELVTDLKNRSDEATAAIYEFTQPPTTDEEQNEIIAAQRGASKLRTELTKQADAYKAPLNAARKTIIDLTNAATEILEKAEKHAQGLVNHRQQKLLEERRRQEAEVERQAQELRNKEAEAQRQRDEAERQRQQAAEAERRAAEAKTAAARLKAEQEAAALKAQAEANDTAALKTELAIESTPLRIIEPGLEPQAKEIRDFVIIGRSPSEKKASLIALLNRHPEFFTCHISETTPRAFSLSLKISDLTDALAGKEPFAKLESSPGITVIERVSNLR